MHDQLLVARALRGHPGDGETAVIGISEYAAQALGDVVFVELPEVGKVVKAGDPVGAVESVTFVRAEDRDNGRVEIYDVKFAGGQTLTWGIGDLNEGKFDTAYTGG